MAMTERQRFDKFLEQHGPQQLDAFWWCSPGGRYCVVLLARHPQHPMKCVGLELRADTPTELRRLIADTGYSVSAQTIAEACETAACSPRQRPTTRRRRP